MKARLDRIQVAVVSIFATVNLIATSAQTGIKVAKEGFDRAYKETGIHQMFFPKPQAKQPAKKK
jgi:hypothetical protein